jgi:DNA repair protein RadC
VGITRRIRQITEELDMPLLDHFIVAGSEITTLADGPA